MKKNTWLTLAALSLVGMALAPRLHAAGSIFPTRPIPNVTPIPKLPAVPVPPISIVPSVNLPGVPSPMPTAPKFHLVAAPVAIPAPVIAAAVAAPAVPVAPAPVTEVNIVPGDKIILPGAFNPNSPVKMPSLNKDTKKVEAKLAAMFDGAGKKEPVAVPVEPEFEPAQEPRNMPTNERGQHISLPEQDLANEIGF